MGLIKTTGPGARRIEEGIRRVLNEPYASVAPTFDSPVDEPLAQFIIASDNTQIEYFVDASHAAGTLETGYDSFVVGYRIPTGVKVADIPVVPDTKALNVDISSPYSGSWTETYKSEKFGRPVLININRLFRGYVFRGEIVVAGWMPLFRMGFSAGILGYSYPWAPSSKHYDKYNRDGGNFNPPPDTNYDTSPGWTAIGTGHTSAIASLAEGSITTSNTAATCRFRNSASMRCQVLVQTTLTAPASFPVTWNQFTCRWETTLFNG